MVAPLVHVPQIDFSSFLKHEGAVIGEPLTQEQQLVVQAINSAFENTGFLLLSDFGFTQHEVDSYFHMATKLFSLPQEYKENNLKRLDMVDKYGYHPQKSEALNSSREPDLKEVFTMPHPHYTKQNFHACPHGFERFAFDIWSKLETVSLRFALACAHALDLPPHFFTDTLRSYRNSVIALNYFPPAKYEPGKSTGDHATAPLRVSEHVDWGLFTILFNDKPGLQVKPTRGAEFNNSPTLQSEWIDIPVPAEACAIVNTGGLFVRWTNDRWKAAAHRVIIADELQGLEPRISIACFVQPDEEQIISVHKKFVKEGCSPKYQDITMKEYLHNKLREARKIE